MYFYSIIIFNIIIVEQSIWMVFGVYRNLELNPVLT